MNEKVIIVASFYNFVDISNPEILMSKLLLNGKKKYLKGTILLAKEGFNGSVSGYKKDVEKFCELITNLVNSENLIIKYNNCNYNPFSKFYVKVKKEIVAMGIDNIDVKKMKGNYILPKDWDKFVTKDDVILIDTRNDYEYLKGSFKNSLNPSIKTFKEFPKWFKDNKDKLEGKKIAMFCTGGIRCEKSTSYAKLLGFKNVYHLKGGILQYLEDTNNRSKLWNGSCFVFDDRISVRDDLKPLNKKLKV